MTGFAEAPSRYSYLFVLSQTTKQTISLIRARSVWWGMTTNPYRKKGLTNMNFSFLEKQASRREMLRYSATLAGSALLAHLFFTRLLRASAAGDAQQSSSSADLLAS